MAIDSLVGLYLVAGWLEHGYCPVLCKYSGAVRVFGVRCFPDTSAQKGFVQSAVNWDDLAGRFAQALRYQNKICFGLIGGCDG
jgi:hypothetical protein